MAPILARPRWVIAYIGECYMMDCILRVLPVEPLSPLMILLSSVYWQINQPHDLFDRTNYHRMWGSVEEIVVAFQ